MRPRAIDPSLNGRRLHAVSQPGHADHVSTVGAAEVAFTGFDAVPDDLAAS